MEPNNNVSPETSETLSEYQKETLSTFQETYDLLSHSVALKQRAAETLMSRPHTARQVKKLRDGLNPIDEQLTIAAFAAKREKYPSNSPEFEACAGEMFDKFSELKRQTWQVERILNKDREKNEIVRIASSCAAFIFRHKSLRPIANLLWPPRQPTQHTP